MPTFFGIDRVVPRRAHSDVGLHRRRDSRHYSHCQDHCDARACLAALQGGQAGAHPDQTQARPAATERLNLPRIKNRHLTGE